jgi:hypothetical protein
VDDDAVTQWAHRTRVQAQLDRAAELYATMRERIASVERVLQIGVALLAGVGAVGLAEGSSDVFMVLPFGLALLGTYQWQQWADVVRLSWQRKQLVMELEATLGDQLFPHEGTAAKTRHSAASPSLVLTQALYGCAFVASLIAGGRVAAGHEQWWLLVAYLAAATIACAASLYAALEAARAWRRCGRLRDYRVVTDSKGRYDEQMDLLVIALGWPGRVWVATRRPLRRLLRRGGRRTSA